MRHHNIQTLIGAAVVDYELRQHLLENAAAVISDFDLTPEEAAAVLAVRATTFQGFASQLHGWLVNSSHVAVQYA
jgi:hypothetical protein